jgi:hypothetical protein
LSQNCTKNDDSYLQIAGPKTLDRFTQRHLNAFIYHTRERLPKGTSLESTTQSLKGTGVLSPGLFYFNDASWGIQSAIEQKDEPLFQNFPRVDIWLNMFGTSSLHPDKDKFESL